MKLYILLLTLAIYSCNAFQHSNITTHPLTVLPSLDSSYAIGVAGAFAGIHNHRLIVAGGANFPEQKPWDGGRKIWYDNLYIFDIKHKKWVDSTYRLPQKMGYGYSFSMPDQVIFVGGDNEERFLSDVYTVKYDTLQQAIQIDTLPSLPLPLSNMTGIAIGKELYIAGGITANSLFTKTFLKLDLRQPEKGWHQLPEWNGQPLALGMLVKQGDYLLLFSGRGMDNGKLTPYKSVYKYSLIDNTWETLTVTNSQILMGGIAVPQTDSTVLFLSGDNGEVLQKIINLQLQGLKDSAFTLQKQHQGFGNLVYLFNTHQSSFEEYCQLLIGGRVTAPVVGYDNGYIVVSGEIRPGIRTPEVIMYEF